MLTKSVFLSSPFLSSSYPPLDHAPISGDCPSNLRSGAPRIPHPASRPAQAYAPRSAVMSAAELSVLLKVRHLQVGNPSTKHTPLRAAFLEINSNRICEKQSIVLVPMRPCQASPVAHVNIPLSSGTFLQSWIRRNRIGMVDPRSRVCAVIVINGARQALLESRHAELRSQREGCEADLRKAESSQVGALAGALDRIQLRSPRFQRPKPAVLNCTQWRKLAPKTRLGLREFFGPISTRFYTIDARFSDV